MFYLEGVYPGSDDGGIPIEDTKLTLESCYHYEKIPNYFFSINEWMPTTELQCVNCTRVCHSYPVPLATKKVRVEDRVGYELKYISCSFSCNERYINTVMDDELGNKDEIRRFELSELQKEIYTKFTGKKIDKIPLAFPKTVMIQYGGQLTPYEYEQKIII
jgi:hypothetical protein